MTQSVSQWKSLPAILSIFPARGQEHQLAVPVRSCEDCRWPQGTVVHKVAGSVQQATDLTCALAFTRWHLMLLPSNWLLSSPGPASWSWAWSAIIARPALGSQESSSRLGQTSISIPSLNKESPHPLMLLGRHQQDSCGGVGNSGLGRCPPWDKVGRAVAHNCLKYTPFSFPLTHVCCSMCDL